MSGEWVLRKAVADDEPCLVSMWLKGYSHSRDVLKHLPQACVDGSRDQIRYWKIHQPIVEALLSVGDVRVVCDPERSTYEGSNAAVIWGWSCVSDDAVHWVGIKRSVAKAGLGEDIVRDLLGDRLSKSQRTTFDQVDLEKADLIPSEWRRDREWLLELAQYSRRVLDGDRVFAMVGGHILDTGRPQWRTSTERAA